MKLLETFCVKVFSFIQVCSSKFQLIDYKAPTTIRYVLEIIWFFFEAFVARVASSSHFLPSFSV